MILELQGLTRANKEARDTLKAKVEAPNCGSDGSTEGAGVGDQGPEEDRQEGRHWVRLVRDKLRTAQLAMSCKC